MTPRDKGKIEPDATPRGNMQQVEVGSGGVDHVEQVARDLGHRWGMRLKSQYQAREKSLGNWPGTLEEARGLVDSAVEGKLAHDERELLALLVERGARRAWHTRAD
jgi:hypothetical protein